MNHDEQDELWELLGRGRQVKASPFFSRNVLRAIREDEETHRASGFSGWFRAQWRWLAVPAAAMLMGAVVMIADFLPGSIEDQPLTVAATPSPARESEIDRLARAASESPEFAALIQNAEMLLASDVNDIWLSDSSVY